MGLPLYRAAAGAEAAAGAALGRRHVVVIGGICIHGVIALRSIALVDEVCLGCRSVVVCVEIGAVEVCVVATVQIHLRNITHVTPRNTI